MFDLDGWSFRYRFKSGFKLIVFSLSFLGSLSLGFKRGCFLRFFGWSKGLRSKGGVSIFFWWKVWI